MFNFMKKYLVIATISATIAIAPMSTFALDSEDMRKSLVAALDAIGSEVDVFLESVEATGVIPGDEAFGTATASFATVTHTAGNGSGTAGTIKFAFDVSNTLPALGSTADITFTYNVDDGVLITPPTCAWTVGDSNIDLNAAILDPDGSSVVNLFPLSEHAVLHGCVDAGA